MAIAEPGARWNRTMQLNGGYLVQPPSDLTSQSFRLERFLRTAEERDFEFYVQSFSSDFEAVGVWTVHQGVLDAGI